MEWPSAEDFNKMIKEEVDNPFPVSLIRQEEIIVHLTQELMDRNERIRKLEEELELCRGNANDTREWVINRGVVDLNNANKS